MIKSHEELKIAEFSEEKTRKGMNYIRNQNDPKRESVLFSHFLDSMNSSKFDVPRKKEKSILGWRLL